MKDSHLYELPYFPLGPFKLRIPFIHYKLETSELLQGLILGVTALSAVPYLVDYLGVPEDLAWSVILFEAFLYILHTTLGDPVVPGWITPSLPLTVIFLMNYDKGPERIQAMMALQLLVGVIFIFMGITKLADQFIRRVPGVIKAGILLATPISVIQGQLAEGGQFINYPISITIGFAALCIMSFSPVYSKLSERFKPLAIMAKYGNLFPYLIAMLAGVLIRELNQPGFELGTVIKIPDFPAIFKTLSVFSVGFPSLTLFIQAAPLAFVCYIIAFGDFVTAEALVQESKQSRQDEYIDFNSSRSNLISGIRNLILGTISPFPPLAGPLWVGMTVSISARYKQGKQAMKSLIGAMASFRIGTFFSIALVPVVAFMRPIFPVGASITLLFQAFVCGRLGMEYCRTDLDKSIACIMAAVLAIKGAAVGLLVGIIMHVVMGNWMKQKEDV